jgi:hypothetical protein
MSFQNYEGFPPGQAEAGAVEQGQAPTGPQGPIQAIESTGGQFQPNPMHPDSDSGPDSKTTLWYDH